MNQISHDVQFCVQNVHIIVHFLHTWRAALSLLPAPCGAHSCKRISQLALNKQRMDTWVCRALPGRVREIKLLWLYG